MIFSNTHMRSSSMKHDDESIFPTIDLVMIISTYSFRNTPDSKYQVTAYLDGF